MAAQVSRDELGDLLIMDAWIRAHQDTLTQIAVSPEAYEEAAPALRAAIRGAVPVHS